MNHQPPKAAEATTSTLTESDLTTASIDELRRRAAEGNQKAVAELARRGALQLVAA